jgi:hypothetical protein
MNVLLYRSVIIFVVLLVHHASVGAEPKLLRRELLGEVRLEIED